MHEQSTTRSRWGRKSHRTVTVSDDAWERLRAVSHQHKRSLSETLELLLRQSDLEAAVGRVEVAVGLVVPEEGSEGLPEAPAAAVVTA